jgi:sugar O-acyltransferase (sialic acid O-acetyltransferase NeuD family)
VNIILWGATGQALVLEELFTSQGDHIVAVFDNDPQTRPPFPNVPIYYGRTGFSDWLQEQHAAGIRGIAAIGGGRGHDRVEIHALFTSTGIAITNAIHPTAFVAQDVQLGEGVQIMAKAAVCARAQIGDACIINTAASVDHECVLGSGVHIGPGATLAGCVRVDDYSFIGAGATVLPRIHIGKYSIVGAGAVVTKDVPDNVVVVGNPARILRRTAL